MAIPKEEHFSHERPEWAIISKEMFDQVGVGTFAQALQAEETDKGNIYDDRKGSHCRGNVGSRAQASVHWTDIPCQSLRPAGSHYDHVMLLAFS